MKLIKVLDKNFSIDIVYHTPHTYDEPFHWHTFLEIGLCLQGKGWFFFGEKTYEVQPGDVFISNNLERHIARSDETEPSKYIFIYFDVSLIDNRELLLPFFSNPAKLENRIAFDNKDAPSIREYILFIEKELQLKQIMYKDTVKSALNLLCSFIFRHYQQSMSTSPKMDYQYAMKLKAKIMPVLQYIKENYMEQISLYDIANVLNLSPSRTYHLFKEATGEKFKNFLTEIRVNEAKRLLADTDESVTDILIDCGFQSHATFYRSFNKIVGITPSDYRTRAQANVIDV